MIKMLLAETCEMMRIGFRSVITSKQIGADIDEAASVAALMTHLATRDYDVLVIEPLLQKGAEETLLRKLHAAFPAVRVLVFTSMSERFFGRRMLRCGVRGYLTKTCSEDELALAVERVALGGMYLSDALMDSLMVQLQSSQPVSLHETLDEVELEIFSMMICGQKGREISAALCMNAKSVSMHKDRIYRKLQIRSFADAVQYAISQNLINDCEVKYMSAPSTLQETT